MYSKFKSVIYKPSNSTISLPDQLLHPDHISAVQQSHSPKYPFPLNPNLVKNSRHDYHPESLPAMSDDTWRVRHNLYMLLTSRQNDCAKDYPAWVLETCIGWTGSGFELRQRTEQQLLELCPISALAPDIESKKHRPGVFAPPQARAMIGGVIVHFVADKTARERQGDTVRRHLEAENLRSHRLRFSNPGYDLPGHAPYSSSMSMGSIATLPVLPAFHSQTPSLYGGHSMIATPSNYCRTPVPIYQSPGVASTNRRTSCPSLASKYHISQNATHHPKSQTSASALSSSIRDSASSRLSASTTKTSPPPSIESPANGAKLYSSHSEQVFRSKASTGLTTSYRRRRHGSGTPQLTQQRPCSRRTRELRRSSSYSGTHAYDDTQTVMASRRSSVGSLPARISTTTEREMLLAPMDPALPGRQPTSSLLGKPSAMKSPTTEARNRPVTSAKRTTFSIPEPISEEELEEDVSGHGLSSRAVRQDSTAGHKPHGSEAFSKNSSGTCPSTLSRAVRFFRSPRGANNVKVADQLIRGDPQFGEYKSWNAPRSRNELPIAKTMVRTPSVAFARGASIVSASTPKTTTFAAHTVEVEDVSINSILRNAKDSFRRLTTINDRPPLPSHRNNDRPSRLVAQHSNPHLNLQTEVPQRAPRRMYSEQNMYPSLNSMCGNHSESLRSVQESTTHTIKHTETSSASPPSPPPQLGPTLLEQIDERKRAGSKARSEMRELRIDIAKGVPRKDTVTKTLAPPSPPLNAGPGIKIEELRLELPPIDTDLGLPPLGSWRDV